MRQFGRRIKVTFKVLSYSFTLDSKNLDIFFDVEKTLGGEANKGELHIYNINPVRVNALKESPVVKVEIQAGYDTLPVIPKVFLADIAEIKQFREGGDIKTVFTIATAVTAKRTLAHDKSWGAGVTIQEVISYIVTKLGYDTDPSNIFRPNQVWKRGLTISSNLHVALDKVLTTTGHEFTIDDDILKVWIKGSTGGVEVYSITEQSGLIGIPEYISEINNDRVLKDGELPETDVDKVTNSLTTTKSEGYNIKTLLNGKLSPNDQIQLTAPKVDQRNSLFTIDTVRHVGSNYGEEFYTEMKVFKGEVNV